MAEISDQEYASLKGAQALLDKLLRDPKTRRDQERLVKVHRPDFTTTDDVAQPYVEKIDKLEKKLDDYLEAQKNSKQDAEADAAFGRLKASGYTDEGIAKIKNLMKERTIPDVEAGAALFDKLNPPPPPVPAGNIGATTWNFDAMSDGSEENAKLLFENEDRWAEQEAMKAFKESS